MQMFKLQGDPGQYALKRNAIANARQSLAETRADASHPPVMSL